MLASLFGSLVQSEISALILIPILTISLSVEVCGKSAPVEPDTDEDFDLEAPVEAADTEADAGAEAGAQAEAPPVLAASCGSSPGPGGPVRPPRKYPCYFCLSTPGY